MKNNKKAVVKIHGKKVKVGKGVGKRVAKKAVAGVKSRQAMRRKLLRET